MVEPGRAVIAENRQARRNYEIVSTVEAGVALLGTEVKSLRSGRANIAESYARPDEDGIELVNMDIPIYPPAAQFNHEPKRRRRLLLNKREISKLIQAVDREGHTLVPLRLYFNARGTAKLELAVGKGRKSIDKREVKKKRDWDRAKARLLRDRG